MTFLAPLFLVAAGFASLVVVGLHFLVTRPPPLFAFPTARFIPRSTIIVTSVARRPQDLLLLLLRVAALMLVGAAFARPVLVPRHRDVARIVLADRGQAVGAIAELRDSLVRLFRPGDRLVLLDSVAREMPEATAESIATLARVSAPASFSAGLIAARRIGAALRLEADSIELLLVSPLARESWDVATPELRAAWPGAIRVVPIAPRRDTLRGDGIAIRAATTDPLRIAVSLLGRPALSNERVRLVRDSATAEDSAWARAGGALVLWPESPGATSALDTSNAVVSRAGALIFPFERFAPMELGPGGASHILARWVDGSPAALEWPWGAGCLRRIAIPVTPRGDFVLRPDFLRLVRELLLPCAGQGPTAMLDTAAVARLAGQGPLAARDQLQPPEAPESPLVPWLLGFAIVLLLLEPLLRRQTEAPPMANEAAP